MEKDGKRAIKMNGINIGLDSKIFKGKNR
ncbi:hypothetical protein CCACVL1_07505 [Corchorus capsularis]|uniref:Uncharacterized protein n=1 Tax=Corchorus capsularis TaxID=210143 RepID=A0A1R3J5P9_COCAP|nr:hypothetical protein CCACVL1_07505 [Corchorus capsularis]